VDQVALILSPPAFNFANNPLLEKLRGQIGTSARGAP
jgi:hypothetical protein